MNSLPPTPLLGTQQRRIVAYALTALACIALAACGLALFLVLRHAVITFSSVIAPLAVAAILGMLLQPLVAIFQTKLKLSRTSSIVLLYLFVITVCVSVSLWIIPVVMGQLLEAIRFQGDFFKDYFLRLKTEYPDTIAYVRKYISEDDINNYGHKALSGLQGVLLSGAPALKHASDTLKATLTWATGTAIVPIYLYYFLDTKLDYRKELDQQLNFISSGLRSDCIFLINEFASILVAFFRSQILIGLLMGILLAFGFSLIGLKFGLAIGLIIGLLNIIPYFGTIIGLSIAIPIAFFQTPDGGTALIGWTLLVFLCVQLIEGNLLTPRIMGQTTGLHPMVIIIAIFFWGTAFDGVLGMILAIPLTAFFIVVWRLAKIKYLPILTGQAPANTPQ